MSTFGDFLRSIAARIDKAIEEAGGDPIEAMHGHKCDADCWHNAWLGLAAPHWLGVPYTEIEHAFPEWIVKSPLFGTRRRCFSACRKVALYEPFYYYARRGRCPDCVRVLEERERANTPKAGA